MICQTENVTETAPRFSSSTRASAVRFCAVVRGRFGTLGLRQGGSRVKVSARRVQEEQKSQHTGLFSMMAQQTPLSRRTVAPSLSDYNGLHFIKN